MSPGVNRVRGILVTTALVVGLLRMSGGPAISSSGAAGPVQPNAAGSTRLPLRNGAAPTPPLVPRSSRPAALPAGGPSSLVNDPSADTTPQDTQSETTVVRVGDSDNLVAAYNDSGSFTSPPVQFTGYSTSADGGRSWTDRGALPVSPLGDLGDPVLAYSARTNAVLMVTLQCSDANCENVGPGVQFFTSTDAGVTFGAPTSAPFGNDSIIDKEWIAVDNYAGSDPFGNVYVMARDFGFDGDMKFIRSVDDGASWEPPVHIADGGQGAFVTVTPDHAVQAFWLGEDNAIRVRSSTDGGLSFGSEHTVATLGFVGGNGDVSVQGGVRSNGFVHVAVAPDSGALFAVFNDRVTEIGTPDVFVTSSTDGGATWSPPTRMNSVANGDQWSPTIAIAPDGATAMVSWYDRRNDPANSSIQRFGAIGSVSAGSLTVGTNVALSVPFPVVVGQDPVINPSYMGDYDMIAAGSAGFVALWGDNSGASAAHAHQPDVRAAVLDTNPSASDLTLTAAAPPSIALGSTGSIGYDLRSAGNATLASLTVTAPVGVALGTPTSANGACSARGQGASCLFGDLVAGSTVHVDVPVVPLTVGTLNITASATHAGDDPNPGDNDAASAIDVAGDLTLNRSTSLEQCVIPDLTTVECPLTVDQTGPAINVTVGVRISHTFVGDLNLTLVAPDGQAVPLVANLRQAGADYGTGPNPCDDTTVFTTFRDDAEQPIGAYVAPFAGAVLPSESLSGVAASEQNGVWKLRIADVAGADEGALLCWNLTTGAVPPPQDPPPESGPGDQTIAVGSASLVEGDSRVRSIRFPVVLSKPSDTPIDVDYVVMGCNALPFAPTTPCGRQRFDFEVGSGTVHFELGPDGLTETSRQIRGFILPDEIPEGDASHAERFSVRITGAPSGWFINREEGFATILDDDPGSGALSVAAGDVSIPEGNKGSANFANVRLTLNHRAPTRVRVRVRLVPIGAEPGADYADWGQPRTVSITAGQASTDVLVAVIPDVETEGPEAVGVEIIDVTGGVEIARQFGLVIIDDDDFQFLKPGSPGGG